MRGVPRLDNDIKLIYAVASNALDQPARQHQPHRRRSSQDERLVEFLVVQDNFLTPTARFADIVLPACTQFETWGVEDGWKYGDEVLLMPKVVEPAGETKSDYQVCAEIAARLGLARRRSPRAATSAAGWSAALDVVPQDVSRICPALDEFEAGNAGVFTQCR